ncbi:MAG: RNA-binding cell elongation regulator Jag/EloR [Syntrophales bacterium]
MKTLEIEGKNIDEAIEKACREFNLPREKLNIEIISEGSSGLLGIVGSRKARIKASVLSLDMEIKKSLEQEKGRGSSAEESSPEKAQAMPSAADEKTAVRARELLEGILMRMGLDFPVSVEETKEAITLKISGDGSGILIGKGGQTLDAIQYILNKALISSGGDRRRIVLDTEQYRGRREDYLISLAAKLAEKVKKTKKPVTVNHMNARDRRIIHLALKGDDALITKSRGEGAYRKIVIMPARKE